MADNATIVKADKDHCFAIWQNILFFVWRGVTRAEAVDEHRKYVEGHVSKNKGALSFFVITEAQSEVPDRQTREKLALLLQAAGPTGSCAALVHEGAGFHGAAVRGIVSGLNALARHAFPYKVFSTVDVGAAWVVSLHRGGRPGITAAEIVRVVAPLRTVVSSMATP